MNKKKLEELNAWLEWREETMPSHDPKEEGISDFWYGVACAVGGVWLLYILSAFL